MQKEGGTSTPDQPEIIEAIRTIIGAVLDEPIHRIKTADMGSVKDLEDLLVMVAEKMEEDIIETEGGCILTVWSIREAAVLGESNIAKTCRT